MRLGKQTVESPTEDDILFGRDSDSWNHEGNRKFRSVVAKYQDKYHTTKSRAEKVKIVAKIVEELQSTGTRFLKRDHPSKPWYEVDRKACIEKVGHAIRDKQAIAQRRLVNKKKREAKSGLDERKDLAFGLSGKDGGQAAPLGTSLQQLCSDGELALQHPAVFEALVARQLLADKSPSNAMLNAIRAREEMEAQRKRAARESVLTALHEQQRAMRDLVASRERRALLSNLLAKKATPPGVSSLLAAGLSHDMRGDPSATLRRRSALAAPLAMDSSPSLLLGNATITQRSHSLPPKPHSRSVLAAALAASTFRHITE